MSNINKIWINSINKACDYLVNFANNEQYKELYKLSKLAIKTINKGGKIFIAGNGGSHADAMHFAEELTGRYRNNRDPIAAIALGSNPAHLTCVSNDYGFEEVFSREFQALAKPDDMLIVLSTSGNSSNILKVLSKANEMGIKSAALLGKDGGAVNLAKMAHLSIIVPGKTSDRIQELHMLILHILVETIEANI